MSSLFTNVYYPGILIRIQSTKCYNVIVDQDPRGSQYYERGKQIYYRHLQLNVIRYYKLMRSSRVVGAYGCKSPGFNHSLTSR
jgi:hypothetical protein